MACPYLGEAVFPDNVHTNTNLPLYQLPPTSRKQSHLPVLADRSRELDPGVGLHIFPVFTLLSLSFNTYKEISRVKISVTRNPYGDQMKDTV
ncbi:hypothetical protein RRG08_038954 [Elysia crispata]|uniref:Uncharacterized protein n=1 Tax=Elysia crispata TaxID=231223 RepID=A0AAE1CU68_9GAST|nr:hypothetical protein RRG08_038954 [Elysia crispata]